MTQLRDMRFKPIVLFLWDAMEELGLSTAWPDPRPVYPVNPMKDGIEVAYQYDVSIRHYLRVNGITPGG